MKIPFKSKYRVTSTYQQHIKAGRYPGVDYVADNPRVYASFKGKVETGYDAKVKGHYVYITSTARMYRILYSHFKPGSVVVKNDQKVKEGQFLGTQGESGNAKGVHTHVSLWVLTPQGYKVIDPTPKLKDYEDMAEIDRLKKQVAKYKGYTKSWRTKYQSLLKRLRKIK